MKTSSQFSFLISAASIAGVALVKLGSAPITAGIDGEIVLAVAASAAVLLFAAYDYSRRIESLRTVTPVLRPSLPSVHSTRRSAYTIARVRRSAIVERAA